MRVPWGSIRNCSGKRALNETFHYWLLAWWRRSSRVVRGAGTRQNEMKKVIYVSSGQANYTTRVKGVSMAKIWGDADKGAHATLPSSIRTGFGMHTHTNMSGSSC